MKILTRDDTEHGVKYVTLDEARAELQALQERVLESLRAGNRHLAQLINERDEWRSCAFFLAGAIRKGHEQEQEEPADYEASALAEYDRLVEEDEA